MRLGFLATTWTVGEFSAITPMFNIVLTVIEFVITGAFNSHEFNMLNYTLPSFKETLTSFFTTIRS